MSIDKSLKRSNRLTRSRNVLKRHERIEQLINEDRWDESKGVLGLPKTKVSQASLGRKKKKKKKEEEEEGGEEATPEAT